MDNIHKQTEEKHKSTYIISTVLPNLQTVCNSNPLNHEVDYQKGDIGSKHYKAIMCMLLAAVILS